MKTYEKPKLIALSLGGNDRLCGDCAHRGAVVLLAKDLLLANQLVVQMELRGYVNVDNAVGKDDFANCFGDEPQCTYQLTQFCKFSATQTTIAWS